MKTLAHSLAMVLLGAALASGIDAYARSKTPCPDAYCDELELKIRHKNALLRQSHSNTAGRRYKAELRRLRDLQRKRCR